MSKSESRFSAAWRRGRIPALALLASGAAAFGQATLVGNSPFMPAGGAAGAAAAPAEAYELAGSSVQGNDVSVCIFERQAKHSRWIPVGGISDGIHVISFDAAHDKVVVTIGGAIKELSMRKPMFASVSTPSLARAAPAVIEPAAPPAPIASDSPAPARTAAQEQREARMLVSDLLEIGVQQRKAYQDAKQKAASEPPVQPTN